MRTMIEEVHSDENNTLGPTANPEPFLLGLPLRPISPPHSSNRPANQPAVVNSQQERTTAGSIDSDETLDAPSSSRLSPVPHIPPADDSEDTDNPDDSDDEYEDSPLPTPRRLRTMFKRPRKPAQESTQQIHVFRLVERGGRRYYDVRGDAVSSPGTT
jgi:hypothetical protein